MLAQIRRAALVAASVVIVLAGAVQAQLPQAAVAWKFSDDGGKTFTLTAPPADAGGKTNACAAAEFDVADPSVYVGGVIKPGAFRGAIEFNGKAFTPPFDDMQYEAIPFDARAVLVKGRNVVVLRTGPVNNVVVAGEAPAPTAAPTQPAIKLQGPGDVAIQTGPILGAAGEDFFTVTCRTNVPAKVTVKATPAGGSDTKEIVGETPEGLYHKLKLQLPRGAKTFRYTVTARAGGVDRSEGPFTVRVPGADPNLRFVILGDNRSSPKRWSAVLAGVKKAQPDAMFNTGDLVERGPDDRLWDSQFFGPARELLQTIPGYAVMGNHDQGAKVYFELIYGPGPNGRERSWSQTIGPVLFIGVDGGQRGGATPQWVENQLAGSKAKFVFFLTHYPAWSSGPHGNNRQSLALMPVLERHQVSAMFAGHDHDYERIEPPAGGGVPCIVSGGGGAPTYQKKRGAPNSKFFFAGLHYCLLEVKGDLCTMKAIDVNGKVFDQMTFKARDLSAIKPAPAPAPNRPRPAAPK